MEGRKGQRKEGKKKGRKESRMEKGKKKGREKRQIEIACRKKKKAFRTGYMLDSIKNNNCDTKFVLIKLHSPFKNRKE